jgi:hypothetical protein
MNTQIHMQFEVDRRGTGQYRVYLYSYQYCYQPFRAFQQGTVNGEPINLGVDRISIAGKMRRFLAIYRKEGHTNQ